MPEKKKPQPRVQLRPGSLASLGGLLAQQLPPDPGVGWVGPERPAETWGEVAADPLSALFDFGRGAVTGDAPTGMNLQGLGALLAAALPLASGAKAFRAATTAEDAAAGIKAYHGSPHDFDKFSLSKIGTGEGAQAYGHGLYFAENPNVAGEYRNVLTQRQNIALSNTRLGVRRADQYAAKWQALLDDPVQPRPRMANGAPVTDDWLRAQVADEIAEKQRLLADPRTAAPPDGRMYEVSINADPEQLLDWDNPLPADSPLRAKLKAMAEDSLPKAASGVERNRAKEAYMAADRAELTGQGVYQSIARLRAKPGAFPEITVPDPRAAADELRQAGIPGIKYLDGGSRAAGEGSRNFVIFDDSLVSILKKYGVALPVIEGLRQKAAQSNGRLDRNDVEGLF